MQIVTQDGIQPVLAVMARPIPRHSEDQPFVTPAGLLGPGWSQRMLRLSPQYRLLLGGPLVRRMFGARDVLVASKALRALPGVSQRAASAQDAYWHIICPAHTIAYAEGCPAETMQSGPHIVEHLRRGLTGSLVAERFSALDNQPIHCVPPMRRQLRLADRTARNGRCLIAP